MFSNNIIIAQHHNNHNNHNNPSVISTLNLTGSASHAFPVKKNSHKDHENANAEEGRSMQCEGLHMRFDELSDSYVLCGGKCDAGRGGNCQSQNNEKEGSEGSGSLFSSVTSSTNSYTKVSNSNNVKAAAEMCATCAAIKENLKS